jgi:hypothetical protein
MKANDPIDDIPGGSNTPSGPSTNQPPAHSASSSNKSFLIAAAIIIGVALVVRYFF